MEEKWPELLHRDSVSNSCHVSCALLAAVVIAPGPPQLL